MSRDREDLARAGAAPPPAGGSPDPAATGVRDPKAAELARRYRDRLRVFAARRLGDPSAAEDVAQETLRRVLQALREDRIENPEALSAYLFQTARHVCRRRRRSALREERALRRLRSDGSAPGEGEEDPLRALVARERREAVRRALSELRDRDRRLLRLFFFEGQGTREVAGRLGISSGATRVRKHRALRRLWEALESRGAGRSRNEGPGGEP